MQISAWKTVALLALMIPMYLTLKGETEQTAHQVEVDADGETKDTLVQKQQELLVADAEEDGTKNDDSSNEDSEEDDAEEDVAEADPEEDAKDQDFLNSLAQMEQEMVSQLDERVCYVHQKLGEICEIGKCGPKPAGSNKKDPLTMSSQNWLLCTACLGGTLGLAEKKATLNTDKQKNKFDVRCETQEGEHSEAFTVYEHPKAGKFGSKSACEDKRREPTSTWKGLSDRHKLFCIACVAPDELTSNQQTKYAKQKPKYDALDKATWREEDKAQWTALDTAFHADGHPCVTHKEETKWCKKGTECW